MQPKDLFSNGMKPKAMPKKPTARVKKFSTKKWRHAGIFYLFPDADASSVYRLIASRHNPKLGEILESLLPKESLASVSDSALCQITSVWGEQGDAMADYARRMPSVMYTSYTMPALPTFPSRDGILFRVHFGGAGNGYVSAYFTGGLLDAATGNPALDAFVVDAAKATALYLYHHGRLEYLSAEPGGKAYPHTMFIIKERACHA